ncbi:MAG: dihydroorotate dehydrogenase electron transfer subunit [Capsulimonadaceae bacterium]|nr:dihydroorotate dehydrogenase electron transfer subunit [Capsulimonadaceae bacterium]
MSVLHIDAQVVDNREVIKDHRVITCLAPDLAELARPGHFVNVLASEAASSILRKPFSIYHADPHTGLVAMLYQVKGPTTVGMAHKRAGDRIDLVGPLGGNVFEPDPRPGVHHVMVGGGYGVPPLVFLSKVLGQAAQTPQITFIVGARSKDRLLCQDELAEMGVNVRPSTEDGSHGVKGRVTDVLSEILADDVAVYCCGPDAMMRAVGAMCIASGVDCQVSLEAPMPCGIGVCMGCVVDTTDGIRVRACCEGPVFDARKVVWK